MTTDRIQPPISSLNGFTALVVDHDPASRLELCRLIESDGGQAIEAKNGAGALLAIIERQPDIVLLDTTLLESGGVEACKQIQALPYGSEIPILMITALNDDASVDLALAAGLADYVTKPIRPAVLRQRMRRLLQVHNTNAAILRAKKEWEAAVDAASDMVILTGLDGKIVRCNLATIQRLQTTYSQLIGRDLGSFLLQGTGQELSLPLGESHEIRFPSLAGWFEIRAFQGSVAGRRHTMVYVLKDITERKHLEENLHQSEQRFRNLTENISEGIMLYDIEGKILYLSPAVTRLTGYGQELVGENVFMFGHPDDLPHIRAAFAQLIEHPEESVTAETRMRHKNGSWVWAETNGQNLLAEPGINAILVNFKDITSRKQLEEALQQSEKRFRAMIENSADAIALLDARGTITYATPAIAGISGYKPEDYAGQRVHQFMHPEDLSTLVPGFMDPVQIPGSVSTWLFRTRHLDGSWRWVNVTTSNQLADPAMKAIIANFRDVTETKQAEEILCASEARYRTLFEDSPVALWEEDYSEVKAFFEHLRIQEGITDFRAYFEAHPEAVAKCFTKVNIKDVNKAAMKLMGAERKEQLFGTLEAIISEEARGAFRDQLISIAGGCTHYTFEGPNHTLNGETRHVSVQWSVCPGYEDTFSNVIVSVMDLTERKRTEELLKQTEERLRLIVETVPIPILISSASDGAILFANTALGTLTGLPVQELLGRHTPDFYLDPSQRQTMLEALKQEGKLHNYELAIKKVDQTPLWTLVSMQSLMFADQPALLAVLYDVTERKHAEAALAESEQRFRQFFAASPDAVLVIDPAHPVEWKIVDCNEAACQMNGYTREEMIGKSIDLLNPTPDTAGERAAYLEQLRLAGVSHLEVHRRRKDGKVFPVEISTTIFTVNGHELILSIDRDVTRRKQAEEDLRLSEERFQLVTYATNDAVWDLDLSTGKRWWNRGVRLLFGYATDQVDPDQTWWEARIHPDDRPKVLASFQAALESDGQFWSKEYRFLRADGSYAYVFDRGYLMQDSQGVPVRVIGAMMDLTERKQSEEALRRREQQLEEAQRIAHLGNWEWNFATNEAIWSKEMYQLHDWEPGSPAPDLETFLSLIHPDDRKAVIPIIQQAIQNLQPCEYDYRIILAGGEEHWLHGTSEFLKEATGQSARFRGTAQDITERKRSEEALRASQAELSEALKIARLAYWEYDFPNDQFIFNDHFYSIFHTTASQEGGYRMTSDQYAQEFCDPHDRSVVGAEIQKMLNSTDRRYRAQLDHRIVYADGGTGYISVRINLERDEQGQILRCYGTVQDITERKRMEEALVESEELFSKAFHASPSPMGISQVKDGLIIDVNSNWERLLGYERQAVIGRSIDDLNIYTNPEDRTTILRQIHEQGKVIDYEVKVKTKSDEELILLMSAQIVEIRNQACLMSAFYDITELRRLHETMLASQKLADLGTLAAGVAHEMNSPLQVITGVSQSLLRKTENNSVELEQLKRNLDVIHRNGWRCAEIVRSLHTYARNTSGSMEPTDLNELVSDGLLLIEHQLKSWANISVRTVLAEGLSPLTCDRNQIIQVLINLLTNARDAMPNGGEITITTGYDPKPDQLILQISDTGVGIPDSIRSKIFDPFFTTKPLGKGTGLGLSIVGGIVRAHGGAIDVNEALPQGTSFTLKFLAKPIKLPVFDPSNTPGRFDEIVSLSPPTTQQTNFVKEFSHDQDSSR